jgi:hypothetical protein
MNAGYNAAWFVLRYFAGGEVEISRLWPSSGFGFGFGAFFTSSLPFSPMPISLAQYCGAERLLAPWNGSRFDGPCVPLLAVHRKTMTFCGDLTNAK